MGFPIAALNKQVLECCLVIVTVCRLEAKVQETRKLDCDSPNTEFKAKH